jgi:hemerythrin-like domain-containing protein
MIVQLGARKGSLDVIDLLLDCHAKIRRFVGIARRMAAGDSTNVDDIRSAAGAIARYFSVAFPQHVADENDLMLPRLFGRDAETDARLARMRDDHAEHARFVDELVSICTTLRDDPVRLAEVAPELRRVVSELEVVFEAHLVMEESEIFPRLASLEIDVRRALVAAMRERRTFS